MTWTDPPSYANGQIVTQTDLHVGLRDNMRELWHEIAYVEFNSDVVTVGSEAAPADVVSSGAITYVANPIIVEFYCGRWTNAGGGLSLWDGATDLGRLMDNVGIGGQTEAPVYVARRLTPTAASHTYKVRQWSGTCFAGAGGVGTRLPGFIRVRQRGG